MRRSCPGNDPCPAAKPVLAAIREPVLAPHYSCYWPIVAAVALAVSRPFGNALAAAVQSLNSPPNKATPVLVHLHIV